MMEKGRKRIGFVYFDELHHIHHILSPAVELSKLKGVDVYILTYEAGHNYLRKLMTILGGENVNLVMLSTYLSRKIVEKFNGRLQPSSLYIHEKHIKKFLEYDALVFTDHTAGKIHKARKTSARPLLVLLGHGAGDRAHGYKETHNLFDLVLVAGTKKFERLGMAFPDRKFKMKIGGYAKFDIVEAEFKKNKLFENSNPVILYSPHFLKEFSSWHTQGKAIMNYFLENNKYNLIFAPHFNLFNKKETRESESAIKDYIDAPNVYIDLGSIKTINMSYTLGSDIFLGDVSSQVYEFMYKIRPLIFYNAHDVNWQDDENYTMWQAGKVVESIDELDDALQGVDKWSKDFEQKQKLLFEKTFDRTNESAGSRIARIIKEII